MERGSEMSGASALPLDYVLCLRLKIHEVFFLSRLA